LKTLNRYCCNVISDIKAENKDAGLKQVHFLEISTTKFSETCTFKKRTNLINKDDMATLPIRLKKPITMFLPKVL